MSKQPFILRPGNPVFDEGLAFARFLDTAAEGFFRILLGRRMAEIFAQAYTKPGNEYSFENVLFAVQEERITGMASGFTAEQQHGFPANPLKACEGYPHLRATIIGLPVSPMFHALEDLDDGDFYLASLAVDEDRRGQGIGSALIAAMEERAQATDSKRFTIALAAKNEGAQRLYARHGFEVSEKWPRFLYSERFGLLKMAKPL